MMRLFLEKSYPGEVRLETAETAAQGLAKLAKGQYQIILLDYQLPDQNGLEVLKQIQARPGQKPLVIMVTGQGSEMVAVEALKSGAFDYLIKGQIDPDGVKKTIDQALEKISRGAEQEINYCRDLLAGSGQTGLDAAGRCSLVTKDELAPDVLLAKLKTNDPAGSRLLIYISYREASAVIKQRLEANGRTNFLIIDVTQAIPYDPGNADARISALSPAALDGLDSRLTSLLIKYAAQPPVILIDSVNTPLLFVDFAAAYRLFHRLLGRVKGSQASLIAYYDPRALPEVQVNSLRDLFNG